jgi:pimeloyl-ACP methyl ester carboxylesterase
MPDETIAVYDQIATLLRTTNVGIEWALQRLEGDPCFAAIAARYPDTACSLRGQLTSPRVVERVARLERLPRDQPIANLCEAVGIHAPALVIAHHQDPMHPFEFGAALAWTIPGAQLVRVTSKSVDARRHADEVQEAIAVFLKQSLSHASVVAGFSSA